MVKNNPMTLQPVSIREREPELKLFDKFRA